MSKNTYHWPTTQLYAESTSALINRRSCRRGVTIKIRVSCCMYPTIILYISPLARCLRALSPIEHELRSGDEHYCRCYTTDETRKKKPRPSVQIAYRGVEVDNVARQYQRRKNRSDEADAMYLFGWMPDLCWHSELTCFWIYTSQGIQH